MIHVNLIGKVQELAPSSCVTMETESYTLSPSSLTLLE